MEEGDIWVDKKGKKVEIQPFFSVLYIDEKVRELSLKYVVWECDGASRLSTMGKSEIEHLVAKVLVLVRANCDNGVRLVGVKKEELEVVLERDSCRRYLKDLIRLGFFREECIRGDIVVFPTEKLLKNQKISKTKR